MRQSKIYRTNESGNAMKSLFGQDHLSWKTDEQQGVFEGNGVYDAATAASTQQQVSDRPRATGGDSYYSQADVCAPCEYPNPGSEASCDACNNVVRRYYHCMDCREETGLFDLCTECCAAVYLKQGTPQALARMNLPSHPTHQYATHRMVQVCPPGS